MRKSTCYFIVGLLGCTANAASAADAPSTATFMNVMTLCAAGSTITLDAQLQGSMVSLYEKEKTAGRATQTIVTKIGELLPQGDLYSKYLGCVKDLLK